MNAVPTPLPPTPDQDTIRRILETSLTVIRELARQVTRPKAPEPADEVAISYEHIGRTVRRTILIARRVDAGADEPYAHAAARHHRALLQALREAGHAILDGIAAQATTPVPFVPGLPIRDAALALDRTARGLRRTMLLDRLIAAHPVPRRRAPAAEAAAAQPNPIPLVPPPPVAPPKLGPNPAVAAIAAAHNDIQRADRPERLDSPDRIETIDPTPAPGQLATLAQTLAPLVQAIRGEGDDRPLPGAGQRPATPPDPPDS